MAVDSDDSNVTSTNEITAEQIAQMSEKEFNIKWNEYIKIDEYLPQIPTIDIPTVDIGFTEINIDIPNLDVINYETAITDTKSVVNSVEVNIPNTNTYIGHINIGETIDLSDTEIQEILLTIPEVYTYDNDILEGIRLTQILKTQFKDQRSIEHDTYLLNNQYLNEWLTIYKNYKNIEFKQLLNVKPFRMISEVRLPKSDEEFKILADNLSYYKSQGYDSALITFDGSEKAYDLRYLAIYIKQRFGLRVFFAFGGKERLAESIFINPRHLQSCLANLAIESEGFLIAWRRTSIHLLEQDDQFMNFMIKSVRDVNPKCHVFGEFYYGNTAKYPTANKFGFGQNIHKCSSAIVINNFGFSSVDIQSVITKLVPSKIGKHQYIGLVIGQRPYYLTTNKNGLTFEQNREIKVNIENMFKSAGCIGTITLHDDGKDLNKNHNNNLSATKFN